MARLFNNQQEALLTSWLLSLHLMEQPQMIILRSHLLLRLQM